MPKDSEGREPNDANYNKPKVEEDDKSRPKDDGYMETLKNELKNFIKMEIKGLVEELKFNSEGEEEKPYDEEEDRKTIKDI